MKIVQLNSEKLKKEEAGLELDLLLKDLRHRNLSPNVVAAINEKISKLNDTAFKAEKSRKTLNAAKAFVLSQIEKKHGLVPKKYYTNLWLPLGMSVFGLPMGVVLSIITDNFAFIGIGLPIGLGIGSLYGASLDKKAESEGRVLNYVQK